MPQQLQHVGPRRVASPTRAAAVVDAAEVIADVRIQHMVAAPRAVHAQRFQCLRRAPLRPNPYDEARKSASKMGASTSVAAICATRSLTVGMPRGRCRPSAFGIYAAGPAADDTCLFATRRRGPEGDARRRIVRPPRASAHRRPPRRGSSSPAAMPPGARHLSRSDPSGHGSGAPGIAWPRPTAGVAIGALCRDRGVRGSWNRTCRSCPHACLLRRRDHRRDPSLRSRCSSRASPLLQSPRTPAAHDALSPSAYTHRSAATTAAQTGLSCSVPLRARVLRPLPRRDPRHVHLRTEARGHGLRRDMSGSALGS